MFAITAYRNDHDAALARAAALERELAASRSELAGAQRRISSLEARLVAPAPPPAPPAPPRPAAAVTVTAPPPPTRPDAFAVGGGLLAGVIAIAVVGVMSHTCSMRAHAPEEPSAEVVPVRPTSDRDIALLMTALGNNVDPSCTITTEPAGAEVRVVEPDGDSYTLGVTPLTRSVVGWGSPRDVVSIELPGYEPVLVDPPSRRPCDRDVELVPVASP